MPLKIVTADERLEQLKRKNTFAIFGPAKVGKTSLLRTLDPATTFVADIESGLKSVSDVKFRSIPIQTYREACDVAVLCGGPNPALRPQDTFSTAHYQAVVSQYPEIAAAIHDAQNLFWDSISDLTHVGFQYGREITPPGKNGNEDVRGVYGELGRQVVGLLKHVQFASAANVFFVGKLDKRTDDFGRDVFEPQMVGGMVGRELPGIVDHVLSLCLFDFPENGDAVLKFETGQHRAFVCHRLNPWGLPAGTRSSALELLEKPHLGELIDKINASGMSETQAAAAQ